MIDDRILRDKQWACGYASGQRLGSGVTWHEGHHLTLVAQLSCLIVENNAPSPSPPHLTSPNSDLPVLNNRRRADVNNEIVIQLAQIPLNLLEGLILIDYCIYVTEQ